MCYPSVIRHRIDTIFPTSKLFCISKLNDEIEFENVEIVQNDEQWEEYMRTRGLEKMEKVQDRKKTIVVRRNGNLENFQLPASVSMDECTGYQNIESNRNLTIKCKPQQITDKQSCEASTKYFNSQSLFDKIEFLEINENVTESIRLRSNQPIIAPQWNGTSCIGVLKHALVTFWMNSSRTVDVELSIVYDVLKKGTKNFEIEFEVVYLAWKPPKESSQNSTVDSTSIGYKKEEHIYSVNGMVAVPFSIPTYSDCLSINSLQPVLFHRSITGVCTIMTASCEEAKIFSRRFYEQIFPRELLSAPSDDSHPAIIKSSNVTWDEKTPSSNTCRLPVSSLLQIYTAKEGSTRNYREVIVSGNTQLVLDYVSYNPVQPIRLPISIVFTDVTGAPKSIFSSLPYVDIRLPNDFFYPFIKNTGSAEWIKILHSVILFLVFCVFIL